MAKHKSNTAPKFDIKIIISELRETCQRLKDYLKEKHPEWLPYEKEIDKAIYDKQEIGQCDNCDYWTDLGELNEQSECEGCNTMDEGGEDDEDSIFKTWQIINGQMENA